MKSMDNLSLILWLLGAGVVLLQSSIYYLDKVKYSNNSSNNSSSDSSDPQSHLRTQIRPLTTFTNDGTLPPPSTESFSPQPEIPEGEYEGEGEGEDLSPITRPVMSTYYEPVEGGCCGMDEEGHRRLLEQWKEAWHAAGWDTRVLSFEDARRNPDMEIFLQALDGRGVDGYNRNCFFRWFAMAASGGGWMCDYDTFPLHITTAEGMDLPHDGKFAAYESSVPSLLSGSEQEWRRMSNLFSSLLTTDQGSGERHVTDMRLLDDIHWSIEGAAIFYGPREAVFQGFPYVEGDEVDGNDGGGGGKRIACGVLDTVKALHVSHSSVGYAVTHGEFPLEGYGTADEDVGPANTVRGEAALKYLEEFREQCIAPYS